MFEKPGGGSSQLRTSLRPVTGINRANSQISAFFVIAQDKLTLCRRRFCQNIPVQRAREFFNGLTGICEGLARKQFRCGAQLSGLRLASLDRGVLHQRCGDAAVLQPPVLDFLFGTPILILPEIGCWRRGMGRAFTPLRADSRHGPELFLRYLDAAWADCVVSVQPELRFFYGASSKPRSFP